MHTFLHRIATMKATWELNSILKLHQISSRLKSSRKPYPLRGESTLAERSRGRVWLVIVRKRGAARCASITVEVPMVKRISACSSSDPSVGGVVQQRGPQNLIFTAFFHLIMASGVGEEEIKVDSSVNFCGICSTYSM